MRVQAVIENTIKAQWKLLLKSSLMETTEYATKNKL
jgi:hypothetical protein